jgi:hypothetical protein
MMRRWLLVWVIAAVAACSGDDGGGGDDDDDDDGSEVCTTDYSCENGVCECADGTACDDADDCDVVCEICN